MLPINSDAAKTVVAVAAQRIAAYADRNQIQIDQAQCEELADNLVHVYQVFFAGLSHSSAPTDARPTD
ncbi:hypothetical protein GCM10022251_62890 [Phytohabitans flavus]|uniref:Uncharacterized protein n=2 Tax=Phytohabitans flavus TaxID=1076124 RepID=A0A6F8Y5F7_9ACTN|nr:hypothetical protein Pflav_076280 [Phytohabitans flavus]